MNEKLWVQHKSGQGEKFEVIGATAICWDIRDEHFNIYHVPRPDYRTCDPPERWEDVTGAVDYCGNLAFAHRNAETFGDTIVTDNKGYRFTKIDGMHNGPAFIVERKKQ